MNVILLKNVDKVGYLGEVKDVAGGYFRNFLLPRGLAKQATPAGLREAEQTRARAQQQHTKDKEKFSELIEKLKGDQLIINRKATEEGHLFGSVSEKDIAAALSEKGYSVSEEYIHLDKPIKELGNHTASLRYGEDVADKISLTVERGTQ